MHPVQQPLSLYSWYPEGPLSIQFKFPGAPQDLKESGMLVEAQKFSKFLHASAELHRPAAQQLPHWYLPDGGGAMSPATIQEMKMIGAAYEKVCECSIYVHR